MLREITSVKQEQTDTRKRGFQSSGLDLLIWEDSAGISAFQLSYNRGGSERALSWKRTSNSLHVHVDNNKRPGKYPITPLLTRKETIVDRSTYHAICRELATLESAIQTLVTSQLAQHTE